MKLWSCCQKEKSAEEQRDVKSNDVEYNSQFQYATNGIKTSRYTWYNFLIINLWEQFHRVVNIYFIFLLILQYIPQISSLNPTTTLIPIVFVLSITAVKDAVDDLNRHRSDRSINNRVAHILIGGKFVEEKWANVTVGSILRLKNNDPVTADLVLLSSSEENDLVYIETAELDGETNLKVKQSLPHLGSFKDDLSALSNFKGRVVCEAPNNQLHKFTGNMYHGNDTIPIDNQSILLRGCTLRNTEWCVGLVIFAGPDTKLMRNTGKAKLKRTNLEILMNKLVWMIFASLLVMATVTAIGNSIWETLVGVNFQVVLPWEDFVTNPQLSGFLSFWSYIIILNTVVPISLYVSVEFIRLGQSFFINWDLKMYYAKKDIPAVARTTTLNEELGQIEYIFSDKTGTLTQNVMEFHQCSIDGKSYGTSGDEDEQNRQAVDWSYNQLADPNFEFYDQSLIDNIKLGDEKIAEFFRLIAINHTVMPDYDDEGQLVYQAQSPDEGALVIAARNFGFVFKARTFDTITTVEMGEEITYRVLAILDFDNVRKRMSVIVEHPDGEVVLYCKGADTVIYELLKDGEGEDLKTQTTQHLDDFARTGLRTLCLAVKHLDNDEYDAWNEKFIKASTALENRDECLAAVYEEIEKEMTLLGATAIEDKLQDGVPETIANLSKADIKIWVLTGDKQETAINIGYSCNMLTESMHDVFIINDTERDGVDSCIKKHWKVVEKTKGTYTANGNTNHSNHVRQNGGIGGGHDSDVVYGLVITGQALVHALSEDMEEDFLRLASECTAVICCRVTPLQKAQVVELVKKYKKAVTLAIGDGANDVSMIKAAHIGVGIAGEEGTQAVLSSDFAFGQFRYLERLLLVHGRWSYTRMCKFFGYFFYKNFAFTLVHFWYSFFNGLTAQTAYDDWFITLYNIVYTSTPIFVLALLEQDVQEEYCIRFPKLYAPGQKNELFNVWIFFKSLLRGTVTSLVLFFVSYGAFHEGMLPSGRDSTDFQTFSFTLSTALIIVVTLQVALDTSYWTPINHFFIWGSIGIFVLFSFALSSDGIYMLITSQFPFVGVTRTAFTTPALWFVVILIAAICILPSVAHRSFMLQVHPTYADEILQLQIEERKTRKMKKRGKLTALPDDERLPTAQIRRRNSRPKSGYAFAHQKGYGDLITSGRMSMRRKNNGGTPSSDKLSRRGDTPISPLSRHASMPASAHSSYRSRRSHTGRADSAMSYKSHHRTASAVSFSPHVQVSNLVRQENETPPPV